MTDFWAEVTLQPFIVSMAAGFVFGLALPGLFRALTERLIPDEHVDVLNAAAGYLVPLLAVPLGGCFFLARALDDVLAGQSLGRALARFLVWSAFVAAVTIGDLLIQRLRGHGISRVSERIRAIDAQTAASDRRRLALIDSQTDAQRAAKR